MIAYKSVPIERTDPILKRLIECMGGDLGGSSHEPIKLPNLKSSSLYDLFHWRTIWGSFAAEVHGGNHPLASGDGWASNVVYFADHSQFIGGGFLLQQVYSGTRRGEIIVSTWGKCAHEFEAATIGRCLNRYRCTHCREYYDVDSSD